MCDPGVRTVDISVRNRQFDCDSWAENDDVAGNGFPKLSNVAGLLMMSTPVSSVPRVSNDFPSGCCVSLYGNWLTT